jgi:hypothetical protein
MAMHTQARHTHCNSSHNQVEAQMHTDEHDVDETDEGAPTTDLFEAVQWLLQAGVMSGEGPPDRHR